MYTFMHTCALCISIYAHIYTYTSINICFYIAHTYTYTYVYICRDDLKLVILSASYLLYWDSISVSSLTVQAAG